MDCSVCCETLSCTTCPYCGFVACGSCVSTFLLGLSKDSHCMNCSKLWSREILITLMGKSFVNGKHKHHRENLLFEREKSLFPQTQQIIVRENRFIALAKLREETIKKIVLEAGRNPSRWHPDLVAIENARRTLYAMGNHGGVKKPKKKFVRKCPSGGCQGFLSSSWKCGLCEKHICKDCNEVKGKDHVCDPGNVETVKLLAQDTKPCPKCGEMIFKASGCSQMWCTECHCVFDWNTMQVDTGVVHNPHYYEYQRRNGTLQRQPGDVPCGGNDRMPDIWLVHQRFQRAGFTGNIETVDNIHRFYNHLMFAYRALPRDDNLANRKEFMRGKISEYQFKFRIQKNEKHREKKRDIRNIEDMCANVIKDLFIQFYELVISYSEFKTMVDNLVVYTNESLRKVKALYDNCVMEFIDPITFEMVSDSKKRKDRENRVVGPADVVPVVRV
jgi:hypothetical protein